MQYLKIRHNAACRSEVISPDLQKIFLNTENFDYEKFSCLILESFLYRKGISRNIAICLKLFSNCFFLLVSPQWLLLFRLDIERNNNGGYYIRQKN